MVAIARPRRLDPNRVLAKDVKSCTYCCHVRYATLIVRVGVVSWPQNRRNSLPWTVRTSKPRSCNQRVGCLLLYVLVWLRSMIYGMGGGLVPYCGQDGYRAKVPQPPIDSYKHLINIYILSIKR